ncbi:hypothetical protein HUK80_15360 [Flavobacterium sp. MAH-1]|uniref:Uncharacterized protein n=1 Tax=Flavobacterium agri TaxID=2743471 RepID=A0A7Y8Y4J3_9FLAO|nr:hypothetical protein [Flavobacterium agri]NUY82282.1 hypothetical protein [Flavobacterium agri]NYA72306.1 hypothetical protein [Flavobacterium agri]
MKKLLWLALLVSCNVFAQDEKDAASDKASLMEGRLRDAKPTFETKLADGTQLSVWTLPVKDASGKSTQQIVRASAKNDIRQPNEGIKSIKSEFNFASGKISDALYNETLIVQSPTPSVTSKKKEFVFTDGVQSSPTVGSIPEIEVFINNVLSEIAKISASSNK